MEIIFGLITAFVLSIAIRLYLRFFAAEGARHKPFEHWCRTKPVVAALRCDRASTVDVYEVVRRQIEPWGSFINTQGRFPWQHYVIEVDCRRASDEVIVLTIIACRPLKLRDSPRDLATSLREIGRASGERVDEIWLTGQLHAVNRVISISKSAAAWIGEFDESGALQVDAMIGQPPWLSETLARAA